MAAFVMQCYRHRIHRVRFCVREEYFDEQRTLALDAFRFTAENPHYRQDAAKRQTAGIKFTHRPKIRFIAPQGRLVAPIHVKLGRADGHPGVRLAVRNFTSIVTGGGNAAPNIKNFHFLVKSRPAGATPLTDFENF